MIETIEIFDIIRFVTGILILFYFFRDKKDHLGDLAGLRIAKIPVFELWFHTSLKRVE